MRAAVFFALAAGCYASAPQPGAPCGDGRACPRGLTCIGTPGTCERMGVTEDAPTDVADACPTASCSGNDLVGCGEPVTCVFGCSSTPAAHCAELVPSNGLTPALLAGATADVLGTEGWSFHTDDGEIRKGNVTLRPAGTGVIAGIRFEIVDEVGVFAANSFTMGPGNDWSADGAHPLTLYAATTIAITETLDAAGDQFGQPGAGGSANNASTTGTGCRGRAGRRISAGLGEGGGGGGGAISLVAMQSISISGSGAVSAPGGGGVAGANADGGGGGGGGGAVMLEAPFVSVKGALTAGGGGGAGPQNANGNNGVVASTAAASGGSYTGPGGTARGGNGGAAAPPQSGGTYA
jgi:hypothetical protein